MATLRLQRNILLPELDGFQNIVNCPLWRQGAPINPVVIDDELAFGAGGDFSIVQEGLQIPFALHPTEGQVGLKRAIFPFETRSHTRCLYTLLQPRKRRPVPFDSAPDHPGALQVRESPHPLQSQREWRRGGELPQRPAQSREDRGIYFTQELQRKVD